MRLSIDDGGSESYSVASKNGKDCMQLYRSIATVGGFTFLSRITGLVRDVLIAGILGASGLSDAFFVALKLPNFFRRFFAEGAFNAAFVPQFSRILTTSGPFAARLYGENIFAFLFFGLTGFVLLMENFMPVVVFIFAPGFESTPERFQTAVTLTHITFPYIFFISLAALLGGILNSMGKFAASAGTPIILNVSMIIALLLVVWEGIMPGIGLAWAVFWAGFFQLVWLWVSCSFHGMPLKLTLPKLNPDIKKLVRLGIPGALGAGVIQVNLLMDTVFASWLPSSSVSYLFYADRLNQLPLGVIGIAVSTALLPALSKHIKNNNHKEALRTQNRALEFALAITLPAAVGLMILGLPVVTLLFERGEFSLQAAQATGHTLSAFVVGLPAYVLVKILSTQFFARQDTKTPMKVAFMAVGLNFLLNCLFIGPFSYVGLALATALSSWFNALILGGALLRKNWIVFDKRLKEVFPRLLISSLFMGGVCTFLQAIIPFPEEFFWRLGIVAFWIFSGFIAYVGIARLMGTFHFRDFQKLLKNQSLP